MPQRPAGCQPGVLQERTGGGSAHTRVPARQKTLIFFEWPEFDKACCGKRLRALLRLE